MEYTRVAPPRHEAAGRPLLERLRFHAARWALLLGVALVTRLAFPPAPFHQEAGGLGRGVLGPLLHDLIVLSIFWLLLQLYRRETYRELKEMAFFAGLLGLTVGLSAVIVRLFPDRPELLPFPFATILITVLYNGRLSVFAAVTLAILLGTQWGLRDNQTMFFGLAGGIAAALSVRVVRRRSEIYLTIGVVAGAYALAAFTLGMMEGWTPDAMLQSALAGAVVALGSASVAMVCLPVAESMTGITTDMTLLELSDPSQPLLRRLAVEAPGTYAHSVTMANVCEAACHAIGANGLLARVGCYYHDIGKLKQPQFFAENQVHHANPHDKLKPEQSAKIIRAHVLDGLELADQAHLPPVIRNFIPEHHGTSRLNFFLDPARPGAGGVDPDAPEFRYPGPRPQSAETAIAMLADSTEAALRVLDDPTPGRVRGAIEHLVERKVASGQLRDAPLTLRDLDRVTEEFVRLFSGMYHSRLEYPVESGGISADFRRA